MFLKVSYGIRSYVGRAPLQVDAIKTAPMDYRFPTTNQAKHCYTRYNERTMDVIT
jgi:hypothetical protein